MDQVLEIDFDLPHPAMPDADWVDCYAVTVDRPFATAREAAEAFIEAFPSWTHSAFALREIVVAPSGLKGPKNAPKGDKVGIFPVTRETVEQLIAGLDDKHLNFRIVVDIKPTEAGQRVSLATIIRRHNMLGRFYLQMVLPFHKAVARQSMRNLANSRT